MASSLRALLEDEAKNAGVNFNALITQILTRYVTTGRHLGKLKLLPVSKDALREVFQRMSKEAVEDAAKTLGKNSAREHILFLFRQANLATVIRFLDFWGGHFEAWDHHYDGRRHFFTMHHDVNCFMQFGSLSPKRLDHPLSKPRLHSRLGKTNVGCLAVGLERRGGAP